MLWTHTQTRVQPNVLVEVMKCSRRTWIIKAGWKTTEQINTTLKWFSLSEDEVNISRFLWIFLLIEASRLCIGVTVESWRLNNDWEHVRSSYHPANCADAEITVIVYILPIPLSSSGRGSLNSHLSPWKRGNRKRQGIKWNLCRSVPTVGRRQLCSARGGFLRNAGVPLLLGTSEERLQWLWLVGGVKLTLMFISATWICVIINLR